MNPFRRRALLASGALLVGIPGLPSAQKSERTRLIGWTGTSTPTRPEHFVFQTAFLDTLREHGFVEGKNLVMLRRYSEGREGRFSEFVEEFVRQKVDLIVAGNSAATHAAKNATRTIPIVMAVVSDPERQGLVASLARPGGNVTGMSSQAAGTALSGKLLQILKEAVPRLSRVALFFNPDNPGSALALKETDLPAAAALGLAIVPVEVRRAEDLGRAFQSALEERVDGLYPHIALYPHRAQIAEFATKHRLPLIVENRQWAELGALISYGIDLVDQYRRVGLYAAKILKGAAPGELPVEQPKKFELVVNLRTAKALGLTVPQSILARADRVIE